MKQVFRLLYPVRGRPSPQRVDVHRAPLAPRADSTATLSTPAHTSNGETFSPPEPSRIALAHSPIVEPVVITSSMITTSRPKRSTPPFSRIVRATLSRRWLRGTCVCDGRCSRSTACTIGAPSTSRTPRASTVVWSIPRTNRRRIVVGIGTSTTRSISTASASIASKSCRPSNRPISVPSRRHAVNFTSPIASRNSPSYAPSRTTRE